MSKISFASMLLSIDQYGFNLSNFESVLNMENNQYWLVIKIVFDGMKNNRKISRHSSQGMERMRSVTPTNIW